VSGSLVFVGYGITAPPSHYDDYEHIDAAGKIVVILRDTPRAGNRFASFASRYLHQTFAAKVGNAEKHKAAGILFVNDRDTARDGDDLLDFSFTAVGAGFGSLPIAHVHREILDRMLESTGSSLADWEGEIDRELRPRSIPLKEWSAHLHVEVERSTITVKN